MITTGLVMLWCLLFYLFYDKAAGLLSSFKSAENERHQNLQNKLHKNFVFKEQTQVRKHSYIFFGAGFFISLVLRSWILFLVVLIGFSIFPYIWIKIVESLRKKEFQRQLLTLIPSLSSMLKSGHGLERALHELTKTLKSPMSDELGFVLKEVQLGTPMEDSLNQLAKRFPSENMMMFIQAIIISRKLGTSLTEAIDNIGLNVLEKEKLRQQIRSLTSQGKMQALVATVMPFGMFGALQFISPSYLDPLLHTSTGHFFIAYSFVSMGIGLFWIYKITHKEYL